MIFWIIIGIIIYLLVGVGVVTYAVLTDPYGGFILYFAPLLIVAYPYFIIKNWFEK